MIMVLSRTGSLSFWSFLLVFILSAGDSHAQSGCNAISNISIQAQYDSICPNSIDTLSVIGSHNADTSYWFQLSSEGWQDNLPAGTFGIDITSWKYQVYGLFQGSSVKVYEFNGNSWLPVTGSLPSGYYHQKLTVDPSTGQIYVAGRNTSTDIASVWKWNGIQWIPVGSLNFTGLGVSKMDLEVYDLNNVYLAYREEGVYVRPYVMKYNGSSWNVLDTNVSLGDADKIDLEISPTNVPYLAVFSANLINSMQVYQFNGTSWMPLHSASSTFQIGSCGNLDIEFIGSTLYFAFDYDLAYDITLLQYSGSNWNSISHSSFSDARFPSIEIDHGTLVMSFHDDVTNTRAYYRRTGSTWNPYFVDQSSLPSYYEPKMVLGKYAFPNILINSDFKHYGFPHFADGAGLDEVTINNPGIYALAGKDSCPEYRLSNLTIVESKPLPKNDVFTKNARCYGLDDGSIQLTANPAGSVLSYAWNNGDSTNGLDSLPPGEYFVEIQGVYCLLEDSFEITEPDPLVLNLQGVDESCKNARDGKILNMSSGGTKPYEVSISGVAIDTGNIEHLNEGNYLVWLSDANHCRDSTSVSVGLTGSTGTPALSGDTLRTLCLDSLLLSATHSNPNKEWWNWTDVNTSNFSYNPSGLTGNLRYVFIDRQGRVIATRGNGIVRRQYLQTGLWQLVNHPYSTNLPNNKFEYLNGVLVSLQYSTSAIVMRCLKDNQTTWNIYKTLNVSGNINDISVGHFRGYFHLLVSVNTGPSVLYRFDHLVNDWVVVNSHVFNPGLKKGIMKIAGGGQLFFAGLDQNNNLILKSGSNNGLNAIDSASQNWGGDVFDILFQSSGKILLGIYNPSTKKRFLLSYGDPVWDTLASTNQSIALRQLKLYKHPFGQIMMVSRTTSQGYVHQYIRGNLFLTIGQLLGSALEFSDLAFYNNGRIITCRNGIIQELIPAKESLSDSAYVNSPGLYQHVARNGDCYAYSKDVWVNPTLEIEANLLEHVSCKNYSDGAGFVSITPESGTEPYSILWSNSATVDSLIDVPASQYIVAVTDYNNCVKMDTILITEPDSLLIQSISTTAPACSGGIDGTAKASVTGGTTPYLYTWPGQSLIEQDSVLIPAQSFQLNVVDANECEDSAMATVPGGSTSFYPLAIIGADSSLCTGDSLLLTGTAPGPDFQWYDLTQGMWDTIGQGSIDPILTSVSNDEYKQIDMSFDEMNYLYVVESVDRDFQEGPDYIKAHLFNKVGWSQIGNMVGIGNNMFAMEIEVRSVGKPVVAYISGGGTTDTLFVKEWKGGNWETVYSDTGRIDAIDLKRSGSSTYFIYAKEGEGFARFGEITDLGFVPIQQLTTPRVFNIHLDGNENGKLTILLIHNFSGQPISALLYLYDGSVTTNVNNEFKWVQWSTAYITNDDDIYVLASGEFARLTTNGWVVLEELPGPSTRYYYVNNDGITFRYQSGRIEEYNTIDGWIPLNSPYGFGTIAFDPFGLPVAARSNTSYSTSDVFVIQFVPDSISGENSPSYMAKTGDYVMLRAGSNNCYDRENARVNLAKVHYDDYEYLYCPDYTINVSAIPVDFNDSTTITWNTGDSIYELGSKQDGQYIFTVTDGICTVTDTILIEQVDDFQFSLDSISDITCPGEYNGYAKVSASSAYTHYIRWSDIGVYTYPSTYERDDLVPGDYSVIMKTSSCNYQDTILFTIADKAGFPAPVVTSSNDLTVCDSMPVNLTCTFDTSVSVIWMSFDSLVPEEFDHKGLSFRTCLYTEIDNELYTYRTISNQDDYSIVKLNNKRWEEVWKDTTGMLASTLFHDAAGNLMLAGQIGGEGERKTEILRIVNGDTSLFSTIEHPNHLHYNVRFEWQGSSLYTITQARDYEDDYSTIYFGKYNGTDWDSLPTPPVHIIDVHYDMNLAQDLSGNFWVGVQEENADKYRIYKLTEAGWTLELTYSQDVDGQSAIHLLPDGTLAFAARNKISSNNYNFVLYTYNGSTWDTISDRHTSMVNTNVYTVDITHDPAGYLMLFFDNKLYTRKGNTWEITSDLLYPGAVLRFLERNCAYPMTTSNSKCFRMNPGVIVGTGNNISVSEPGIYTPVSEKDGCFNDNACNILVRPSLTYTIETLSDIVCKDDTSAVLSVNIESGNGPFNYFWSSGDTSAMTDSLPTGWYVVSVSDNTACTVTDSFEITEPQSLSIQLNQLIHNICGGDSAGQISLSATGGTGALSIAWSNGDSIWNISDLSIGNYTATVSDSLACMTDTIIQLTATDSVPSQLTTNQVTLYLDYFGQASMTGFQIDTFFTDNCGIDSVSMSSAVFDCMDTGINKVSIVAYDISGNLAEDSLEILVKDTTAPYILHNLHTIKLLDSNGKASLSILDVDSGSFDNCALASLKLSMDTFTCNNIGMNYIWLTATDAYGNADSVLVGIEVVDNILPNLTANPVNLYLDATGIATFDLMQMGIDASDVCGIDSIWVENTLYNCTHEGGNSNRVYAMDVNGNMDSILVSFQIFDTISPTAFPYKHYTAQLNASGYALINPGILDSASSDNCSIVNKTIGIDSVTCANVGQFTTTFKVIDQNGYADSTDVIIHVQDNLLPIVLTKTANIYLDNLGSASLTVLDVDNGSRDNCDIQQLSLSKSAFNCMDLGSNQVWLIATDLNNNKDSSQTLVTIIDTVSPVVSALLNDTVYLDQNGEASVVASNFDLGSTDNCGGLSFALAQTDFFCTDMGSNAVTFTVTDGASNSSSVPVNIFVSDAIQPVLTCFGDTGICVGKSFSPDPVFSDNCNASLQQLTGPTNSSSLAAGKYTYTYQAEDSSGNNSACSFELTVADYPDVDLGLDTTVHKGSQINLEVKAGYESYKWNTGSTDRQITPTISTDTVFWVEVKNEYGCISSDTIEISISFVGVEEFHGFSESIRIYPNPTSSMIYLEFQDDIPAGDQFEILTVIGQRVDGIPLNLQKKKVSLDFSHIASGMYWIRITRSEEIVNIPVVVK